ncbi:hypothetical protein R50072_30930 [Simiduia litorea]|uniref:DUF6265 family protein n=1 Tax=Simiduia litorea TaxID=1435348 RepID=UPI0036F2B1E1
MRITLLTILLCLTSPSWAQHCNSLTSIDWLLGEWVAKNGDRTSTETWLYAGGATYEGVGKTFSLGQLKSEESLIIAEMSGVLYLIAKVNHNALPVAFGLVSCTVNSVRFENLAHDFPKRIEYKREGENQLAAYVSDAESKSFSVHFTRKVDTPR